LQDLNAIGYGLPGSDLRLDLVYKSVRERIYQGTKPPLEKDFKKALKEDFDISVSQPFLPLPIYQLPAF